MNKPKGVYCTNVSQGVQKRAIDLLPEDFPYRVYPVGRLDAESRGLLLLTNDGELTNQLTHPRYGIAKTYVAEVEGYVQQEEIRSAQQRDLACGSGRAWLQNAAKQAEDPQSRADRQHARDYHPRKPQPAGPPDAREPWA